MLTKYIQAKECVTYGKTKETCDKRGNHTTQVFELKNDGSLLLHTILNTAITLVFFGVDHNDF